MFSLRMIHQNPKLDNLGFFAIDLTLLYMVNTIIETIDRLLCIDFQLALFD